MNNQIKFIYFDLGGVVIKDFSGTNKWDEMLTELGLDSIGKENFRRVFRQYVDDLTTGSMDSPELIEIIQKEINIIFPKNYNIIDDFVTRFEANKDIEKLLQDLKKHYQIGLLTNMYSGMFPKIKAKGILPNISWDTIIDSSVIKMRKPQDNIYTYAEKMSGRRGNEILFIDNLQENLISAEKIGWNILLYNPQETKESNKKILEML